MKKNALLSLNVLSLMAFSSASAMHYLTDFWGSMPVHSQTAVQASGGTLGGLGLCGGWNKYIAGHWSMPELGIKSKLAVVTVIQLGLMRYFGHYDIGTHFLSSSVTLGMYEQVKHAYTGGTSGTTHKGKCKFNPTQLTDLEGRADDYGTALDENSGRLDGHDTKIGKNKAKIKEYVGRLAGHDTETRELSERL